jgi:hypothetical protein
MTALEVFILPAPLIKDHPYQQAVNQPGWVEATMALILHTQLLAYLLIS